MNKDDDGIRIEGHVGTWYVIDVCEREEKIYYLLESEQYGEDVPHIITDAECNVILDDVYNGFDDLDYWCI